MIVKVVNVSGRDLPAYATPLAAGVDLRANLDEALVLKPLERAMVPTGLFMQIPEGLDEELPFN